MSKIHLGFVIALGLLFTASLTQAQSDPPPNVNKICPDYNSESPVSMTVLPCSLYIGQHGGGVAKTFFKNEQPYTQLRFNVEDYNHVPMTLSYYEQCGIPNHEPQLIEKTIVVNREYGERAVIESNCNYDYLEKNSPGAGNKYGKVEIYIAKAILGAVVEISQ